MELVYRVVQPIYLYTYVSGRSWKVRRIELLIHIKVLEFSGNQPQNLAELIHDSTVHIMNRWPSLTHPLLSAHVEQ